MPHLRYLQVDSCEEDKQAGEVAAYKLFLIQVGTKGWNLACCSCRIVEKGAGVGSHLPLICLPRVAPCALLLLYVRVFWMAWMVSGCTRCMHLCLAFLGFLTNFPCACNPCSANRSTATVVCW